jgi:hypothetical protein
LPSRMSCSSWVRVIWCGGLEGSYLTNAFGVDKLVELGGAPHCSMYFGPPYMSPFIEVLTECVQDKSALTSFSRGPGQLTAACRGRCSGNARRHRIPRCCLVAAGMGLKNVVLQLQELPQHPYWPAGTAALVPTNKDDSY